MSKKPTTSVIPLDDKAEKSLKPFLYTKKKLQHRNRNVLVDARCRNRPGQSLVPKKYTTEHTVYTLTKQGKNIVRNPTFRKGLFCAKNFVPKIPKNKPQKTTTKK